MENLARKNTIEDFSGDEKENKSGEIIFLDDYRKEAFSEETLKKETEEKKGETLLKNTLKQFMAELDILVVNQKITQEQADAAYEELSTPQQLAEHKAWLLKNFEETGNDQREKLIKEMIKKSTGIIKL